VRAIQVGRFFMQRSLGWRFGGVGRADGRVVAAATGAQNVLLARK